MLGPLAWPVQEMESKRRLVQRLAAEAEAAFARKKGTGVNEDLDGLDGADGQPLLEMLVDGKYMQFAVVVMLVKVCVFFSDFSFRG